MTIYVETECAIIYRNRDTFGGLSNMHGGYPLVWLDEVWPSSEALYQALRYPNNPTAREAIRSQTGAMAAKHCAYEYINETRPDWSAVKVDFMENVLRLKMSQHPQSLGALIQITGEQPIVEKSRRDNFWGAKPDGWGKLEGQNVLGLLWMLIREELRQERFSADVILPLV
jgi:ribA/ribD-fused uncharacterized protein